MAMESKDNNTTSIRDEADVIANEKGKEKKQGKKGGLIEYFKGVRLEMKKVVWPTKKELGSYTVVVLATCIAFALVFWAVDSGVLAGIRALCF